MARLLYSAMGERMLFCGPALNQPFLYRNDGSRPLLVEMEATGGFEPPNRGFADLRLSPLGYVASVALCTLDRYLRPGWCRGRDLNPHRLTPTAPSRPRVYQFHHLGLRAGRIL